MPNAREELLCVVCQHPIGQHSSTFGCIAKDDDGDCECERRQESGWDADADRMAEAKPYG